MNERSSDWKFVLRIGLGGLAILLCVLPGVAEAEDLALHEVTWGHRNPAQVSRFIVLMSPVRGDSAMARQIEVGKPASTTSGGFQVYSAIVPLDLDEFVAVGAVDNAGVLGPISIWSAVPPSQPGQPRIVEP